MKSRFTWALMTVVGSTALGASLLGCSSGEEGPSVGTRTNWFVECEQDSECGELSCLCGVCSAPCESGSDCNGAESGTCAAAEGSAHALQCGGSSSSSLCLAECSAMDDCADGESCVQGSCVVPPLEFSCPSDALVCSDFEDVDLPEFMMTSPLAGDLEARDDLRVSGAFSLVVTASGDEERTRLVAEFDPFTSGTLYLRYWMALSADTEAVNIHTLTLGDPDRSDWGVNFRLRDGVFALGTPEREFPSEVAVPIGQWFCVQETVTLGDTDGAMELFIDGQSVVSETNIDTLPADGVGSLAVGIDAKVQTEPVTLAIDDLVLAEQPVPCVL